MVKTIYTFDFSKKKIDFLKSKKLISTRVISKNISGGRGYENFG
jgi:hypothetical protein